MSNRVKIALTMGDPVGIGPEIAVLAATKLADRYDISIYGNKSILNHACKLRNISSNLDIIETSRGTLSVNNITRAEAGRISFDALSAATEDVISGQNDALVTAPINKKSWNAAKIDFIGHTEFLAKKTQTSDYAMMFASPKLMVTLVTTHVPISEVSKHLTLDKIVRATFLTNHTLKKYFNIDKPRIAVAGLNPHSGEQNLLGSEESEIISPAIEVLCMEGLSVTGPHPGDSIYYQASTGKYDAVISMYHDQGLTAVKTLDFQNSVNTTIGIPMIRTSVDHGTADDIAWRGIADETNMISAIELAAQMANRNKSNTEWRETNETY